MSVLFGKSIVTENTSVKLNSFDTPASIYLEYVEETTSVMNALYVADVMLETTHASDSNLEVMAENAFKEGWKKFVAGVKKFWAMILEWLKKAKAAVGKWFKEKWAMIKNWSKKNKDAEKQAEKNADEFKDLPADVKEDIVDEVNKELIGSSDAPSTDSSSTVALASPEATATAIENASVKVLLSINVDSIQKNYISDTFDKVTDAVRKIEDLNRDINNEDLFAEIVGTDKPELKLKLMGPKAEYEWKDVSDKLFELNMEAYGFDGYSELIELVQDINKSITEKISNMDKTIDTREQKINPKEKAKTKTEEMKDFNQLQKYFQMEVNSMISVMEHNVKECKDLQANYSFWTRHFVVYVGAVQTIMERRKKATESTSIFESALDLV